jgi:hypothetical protein
MFLEIPYCRPLYASHRDKPVKRKRDPSERESSSKDAAPEDPAELMTERVGTGRITSSGTTVQGSFTEFMTQLSPGDAIIITHPTT